MQNKRLITGNIRNKGNNEWSKRSNYSFHQGTKVSSAEGHNQYTSIPQRESQQINALFPSKVIQSALRKLGIPADLNIPQYNIRIFLTSIPGSLGLRLFPGGIPGIQWSHFPSISKLPQESSPIQFPRKFGIYLPPSSKLTPSRFWKLIPSQGTNASPDFI